MRYLALASDYDGTLAHRSRVDTETIAAIRRLKSSGRKFLLVTGRELPELRGAFPQVELCDWVVAENGALLHEPASGTEKALYGPPPEAFLRRLRESGVGPISVGRAIVATWEPHHKTVVEAIRDLGLDLQVIFNKGAVMVLPAGVNKATGLTAVLKEIGLAPSQVVGVGDAENDHVFLGMCGCAVAVANALPAVMEGVDWVTPSGHGAGVTQLIDRLLTDDLASLMPEQR